ncbi:MAG: hypothetical protein OEM01_03640 [Desulfobulbaceae bacterium]|nr:hypothetical protein [Desulfobulbaceae bacterium]
MVNNSKGKMSVRLFFCIGVFLLGGCAVQKKTVDSYQEKPSQPSQAEQVQPASSKSLPVVENVPQQSYGYEKTKPQEVRIETTSGGILPSLTLVDDRIIAYEAKLQAWDEFSKKTSTINLEEEQQQKIAACQLRIQNILSGYNELHETLLKASSGNGGAISSADQLAPVEREDIAFLESECQQIIKINQQSDSWITGTRSRLLEEKEKEIGEAMSRKDYVQVVALYEQLPSEDNQNVSIETINHYGQALLRTGNAQQAGMVLQNLLSRIRQESRVEQEFNIMKLIADINFGQEDYNRAFERYVDIINRYAGLGDNVEWARLQQSVIASRSEKRTEVKFFAELLMSYLAYNPWKDGYKVAILARHFTDSYPESPQFAAASRIFLESRDKADAWFASVVEQIDRLRAEKKYEEGLSFIEQLPRINLMPEQQEQLRTLADELISAQFEAAEIMRQALQKELEETWNTGLAHLRAKEYDEAITVFSSLLETTYGERARMQVDEAILLAAQENRRKAAELFVRANRTTDLSTKIELLLESRELLRNILIKYPQSDLVDKVNRNMSRIEEEITAIDPTLLDATTSGNLSGSGDSLPEQPPVENSAPDFQNGQVDSSLSTGNDLKE